VEYLFWHLSSLIQCAALYFLARLRGLPPAGNWSYFSRTVIVGFVLVLLIKTNLLPEMTIAVVLPPRKRLNEDSTVTIRWKSSEGAPRVGFTRGRSISSLILLSR
jgi:hypothetical protein